MAGYYDLKRSGEKFMFNLKAGNHEVILTSELYTTKQSADNGITSCKKNSGSDDSYERKLSRSNDPYFVLKAANGEVLGTSQMYSSVAAREAGIASCRTNGPTAPTVDNT